MSPSRLPAEPSPAVPRAIAIIHLLDRIGPQVRDEIARRLDLPRSTCLRILVGLQRAAVVEGDRYDGRWRLRQRLVPAVLGADELLANGAEPLAGLCARGRHVVEVYRLHDGRLQLVAKRPAAGAGATTLVEPGWIHDLRRLDAGAVALAAWHGFVPRTGGPIDPAALAAATTVARRRRLVVEQRDNQNGIRRQAVPLYAGNDFQGVLMVAEFGGQYEVDLTRRLRRAGRAWSAALAAT